MSNPEEEESEDESFKVNESFSSRDSSRDSGSSNGSSNGSGSDDDDSQSQAKGNCLHSEEIALLLEENGMDIADMLNSYQKRLNKAVHEIDSEDSEDSSDSERKCKPSSSRLDKKNVFIPTVGVLITRRIGTNNTLPTKILQTDDSPRKKLKYNS
jgi:hypothetical protein